MVYRTHMAGGAAAALVVTMAAQTQLPAPLIFAAAGAGAFGGLIPDIDHPSSKISHMINPVGAIVSLLFSHRGLFHIPLLYLILFSVWISMAPRAYLLWGLLVFSGIVSHLLLDLLNPRGIPLLFPVWKKRVHIMRIKTGSWQENLVRWTLYAVTAFLLTTQYLHAIHHSGLF